MSILLIVDSSLLIFTSRVIDTLSDAKSLWELPTHKFTDLFVKP